MPFENRLGVVGSPQAAQSGLLAAQGGSTGVGQAFFYVSAVKGGSDLEMPCRWSPPPGANAEGETLRTLKMAVPGRGVGRFFETFEMAVQ